MLVSNEIIIPNAVTLYHPPFIARISIKTEYYYSGVTQTAKHSVLAQKRQNLDNHLTLLFYKI